MGFIYFGSFIHGAAEGIHICKYDENTGTITYKKTVAQHINASHVCINQDILMATDEQDMGYVYVFKVDPKTGDLEELERRDTLAVNPSFITIDEKGEYALITHFSVGDIVKLVEKEEDGSYVNRLVAHDSATCLYELRQDGSLGRLCDVGYHHKGLNPRTMIHKAYQRPGTNLFAENDLEGSGIYLFRLNAMEGKLVYQSFFIAGSPADGARIGVFHPSLPYLYINFQNRDVIAQYDVSNPQDVRLVCEHKLLKDEIFTEEDSQSEIMFHPEKPVLYDFVRGKGYALVYRVAKETGNLSLIQKLGLKGKDPRSAAFTPNHKEIIVAGHDSNAVYRLLVKEDGSLEELQESIEMGHPAAVAFYSGK